MADNPDWIAEKGGVEFLSTPDTLRSLETSFEEELPRQNT